MDGLTNEERSLAWAASWTPSFDGCAIVNRDLTFRSVNPQFCEILNVTPAELIGQSFKDITPATIRHLDVKNANLVINGVIESYILPKTYEFSNGRKVSVVLLVRGVYNSEGQFLFFISRIMMDGLSAKQRPLHTPPPKLTRFLSFLKEYSQIIISAGLFLGALFYSIWTAVTKE